MGRNLPASFQIQEETCSKTSFAQKDRYLTILEIFHATMRNVLQDGDVKALKKKESCPDDDFVGAFNGNGFKHPQNEALKTSHAYDTIDGRKPAPPNMYETLLISIFTISTGAFLPSTVPGNEHSETKWPHLSQILNMANVSNGLKQPRLHSSDHAFSDVWGANFPSILR